MQTLNYEGLHIKAGATSKTADALVIEAALQIDINNEPYTVVMRTPGDDFELISGLLYAEDIYKHKSVLKLEIKEKQENGFCIINATIPQDKLGKGYLNKRTLLSVSSCGICGKQKLEDIKVTGDSLKTIAQFDIAHLEDMFNLMQRKQKTFGLSGGSHAAALFSVDNSLLSLREDIGRHNAVDKTIGDLLLHHKLPQANCMLVSGRVSYEIISKAFIAQIPIVIAVSACSSLAVDFAKEFGICLIGFSRGQKATIYAKPSYVKI